MHLAALTTYPDPAYVRDQPAQEYLTRLADRRLRLALTAFIGGVAAAGLFALSAWPPFAWAIFALLFAATLLWTWRVAAPSCTGCGQPMRRQSLSSGTEEQEFSSARLAGAMLPRIDAPSRSHAHTPNHALQRTAAGHRVLFAWQP